MMPGIKNVGRRVFGLFERIGEAVLGSRQKRLTLQQQAAIDRERRAGKLAERAAKAQQTGEEQAQAARRRGQAAKRRGDKAGVAQAWADELKADDFTKRQRLEREAQERRERESHQAAEQAVRDAAKLRTQAREALLRTRKRMVAEKQAWPFAGPAPKAPKQYRNVNSGAGELPDEQAFLMGVKFTAFASSNVIAMQFDPRNGGDLYIQYAKKGWYRYAKCGQAFALAFYNVPSKGVHVWDTIRVRGENPRLPSPPASTRKSFQRGVAPPSDLPLTSSAAMFGAGGGF